jgi:HAMP domain-containing protein
LTLAAPDIPTDRPHGRTGHSIRVLLLGVVLAALIPVFLISFAQAFARHSQDQANARDNLLRSVALSARYENNPFGEAARVLEALAVEADVQSGGGDCRQIMRAAISRSPYLLNAARTSAEGWLECSVRPMPRDRNVSRTEWFRQADRNGGFQVFGPVFGQMSGRPILLGILPVERADGEFDGFLGIGINLEWMRETLKARQIDESAVVAIVNDAGSTVATTKWVEGLTFSGPFKASGELREGVDARGRQWLAGTAPLGQRGMHLLIAMPENRLFANAFMHMLTDLALPVLALILASAAVWAAMEHWALRPIEAMRRLAGRYARGQYEVEPPNFAAAPVELGDLCDDLVEMAKAARSRGEALRRSGVQKDRLIREIHHRVRNNIQIMISLLSLQESRVADPVARQPLLVARQQVSALGLVNSLLIGSDDESAIDGVMLLKQTLSHVVAMNLVKARWTTWESRADPMVVPADTAVPLALFLVTVLGAGMRALPGGEAPAHIEVSLIALDETKAQLLIRCSRNDVLEAGFREDGEVQLVSALVAQMGGHLMREAAPTGGGMIRTDFILQATGPNVAEMSSA